MRHNEQNRCRWLPRWRHLVVLLLMLLVCRPSYAAVTANYLAAPFLVETTNTEPSPRGTSHITFKVCFAPGARYLFYYAIASKLYPGEPLNLYVDGVYKMNILQRLQSDNVNWFDYGWNATENALKKSSDIKPKRGYLSTATFSGDGYRTGTIALKSVDKGDNSSVIHTFEVCLEEQLEGVGHTIELKGKYFNLAINKSDFNIRVNMGQPSMNMPSSAGTVYSSGNRTVTHKVQGLTPYVFSRGGQTYNYRYTVCDYKQQPSKNTYWDWTSSWASKRWAWIDNAEGSNSIEGTFTVPSNYEPTTIYPRLRAWTTNNFEPNPSQVTAFNKDYSKIIIPGFVRPDTIKVEGEQWSRNVKVTWGEEKFDKSYYSTDGKWVIFRRPSKGGELKKLGSTAYTTKQYVDRYDAYTNKLDYDTDYDYYVVFLPNKWDLKEDALESYEQVQDLWKKGTVSMSRQFQFDLAGKGNKNDITLDWTYKPSFVDASGAKPYTVQLYRAKNGGTPEVRQSFTINNASTTTGTYKDTGLTSADDEYSYFLKVNAMATDWTSDTLKLCISGRSKATAMEASRGNYPGTVKLYWNAEQIGTDLTYYDVYRRPLGSVNEDDWSKIYTTSGTANSYSYDDNTVSPGSYYQYQVRSQTYNSIAGKFVASGSVSCDGFGQATGIISGRVFYDNGTAVDSVRVSAKADNTDISSHFHSLRFTGSNAGVTYDDAAGVSKMFDGKNFTVQMYVRPENSMTASGSKYDLFNLPGGVTLSLGNYTASTGKYTLFVGSTSTGLTLEQLKYAHVAMSYNNSTKQATIYVVDENDVMTQATVACNVALTSASDKLQVGYGANNGFVGYLDEFRLFSGKALTEGEVLTNYNRTLSGNESNLSIYWTFDEGVEGQTFAYDYSKHDGVQNGRHGKLLSNTSTSPIVPSADQLGLMAMTDNQGNYVIRGIPFCNEGTNYVIRTSKGTHDFAPSSTTRYVSRNSLVYSGVDFTDISSFPVSGVIYYENTTYPVEGATLYVDGVACVRDGEIVTTNPKGEFEIDVPIGNHYISVSKVGHTFLNDGRYPAKKSEYLTVVKEVKGLTLFDNTLVPIVGRVSGGPVENEYALGLGVSTANIGQAELTLTASDTYRLNVISDTDEGSYEWVNASTDLVYDIPEKAIVKSRAVVGSGTDDNARTITITTDPETGEFAAMVPPLQYMVTNVRTVNGDLSWSTRELIDASDPTYIYTDSAEVNGFMTPFEYVASFKKSHRTEPIVKVKQVGAMADGAFGEYAYTAKGENGDEQEIELYDKDGDYEEYPKDMMFDPEDPDAGFVPNDYTFGNPVFLEGSSYDFEFTAYEEYTNQDTHETTQVPLAGVTVDISNALGSGTAVLLNDSGSFDAGSVETAEENTLQLDSLGTAIYRWTAGLPNIQEPFTRTMSATFTINNNPVEWDGNGFAGIILGCLPTGSNFVTAGPDKVMMVLRDPPGSASSAYVEEGTTFSYTDESTVSTDDEAGVTTVSHLGQSLTLINGAVTGGPVGTLIATSITTTNTQDLTVGLTITSETNTSNSTTHEVTTSKRISTSAEPDFVGADGDVFIGSSTNYIFGKARQVGIFLDGDGEPSLERKDVMGMGTQFSTAFQYSQHYIETTLLPNLAMLRDSMLVYVSPDKYDSYKNNTDEPIYITKLKKGDYGFGSSNNDSTIWDNTQVAGRGALSGPSYKILLPKNWNNETDHCNDTILWYNSQIANWKQVLYNNERAKAIAIDDRNYGLIANYSFDSGSSIEASTSKTTTKDYSFDYSFNTVVIGDYGMETSVNDVGVDINITGHVGTKAGESHSESNGSTQTVGYTLAESGTDDALTVDVLTAPDSGGPVFYTRGGQTSCPYEDETLTKYFNPGQVISTKTMQIEQPSLTAEVYDRTGVPSGKAAIYNLVLQNTSEIEKDVYFNISVLDESNPNGAAIFMDGANLNYGRTILVPAGKPLLKTIQLFQTDENIYDYEKIALCLSSTCDDNIESVIELNAHFQRACSDIAISTEETAITMATGSDMHVTISNYDKNSRVLESVTLQCQQEGDYEWTNLKTWQKSELANAGTFDYTIDFSNDQLFPDGNYILRAITNCNYGDNDIVNNESNEIRFVKDVNRPQLIANASPADGVLNAGDEISLTFNEDIRSGAISKADNFYIRGELNEATIAHDVALNLTAGEPAKTESRIDLSDRSWAVNMWVKYTEAGHILTHGVAGNQFDISVDASNKLVVSIKDQTYTSSNALQKNTWMFLSLAYDNDNKTMTSHYAYDDREVRLFNAQPVEAYTGNGALALGEGLTGQIHEVTLWNNARQWADALTEKSKAKNRYTEGLMGYWRLNEGHGDKAEDLSRSRSMTLPSATAWHLENVNYALNLNGSQAAALPIGALGVASNDSYLLELWFRADAGNTKTASIVSLGNDELDLRLTASGALEMLAKGTIYNVSADDYRDGQWHHLALNSLKSTGGNATLYVDGTALKSFSANLAPNLAGDQLTLGAHRTTNAGLTQSYEQHLKGAVDEVRIWKQRCTADVIRNNMYQRVDESLPALVAYYPFEATTVDEGMLASTQPTPKDQSKAEDGSSKGSATLCNGTGSLSFQNTNVAPLKSAPMKQNVSFDFVASDRKLLINLNESPELLEGCTVTVTVKSVRDQQNNSCENITWDIYIRQNQLTWSQNETSLRKEGTDPCSFTVDIVNNGGSSENYTITNLPAWLSVSSESGTMLPLSTKTITFTVDPATAAGRYEQAIYLTGSLNIKEPLVVSLNSAVAAPDWAVNPDDYEYSMSMIGRLQIEGAYSEDDEDIVAAFNGIKCVGVAKPMYLSRYDGYYLMMTVYGNEVDNNKPLTFKVFDASTGTLYPVVETSLSGSPISYKFQSDAIAGTMQNPVIFAPSQVVEQTVALRKGWTWASIYVTPAEGLSSILTPYNETVSYIKSRTSYSELTGSGSWSGDLTQIVPGTMYKLIASDATQLSVLGTPVDPTQKPLTIVKGWNWIGYNCSGTANLNTAFADLSPVDGDMVKSQNEFSVYIGGEWLGRLSVLTPGMGYCYKSEATGSKTFRYPNVSSSSSLKAPRKQRESFVNNSYESNMTIVAQVMNGDEIVEGAQVAVLSDNDVRALSQEPVTYNDSELHFLTVFGKSGDKLHYVVTVDDTDYIVTETLTFQNDGISGSPVAPLMLQIGDATGIKGVQGEGADRFYDLSGRRLSKKFANHGVYIKNGTKVVK